MQYPNALSWDFALRCTEVVCGVLGAEVRYPNEVSPGDFLSPANVKIVQNAARTVLFSG